MDPDTVRQNGMTNKFNKYGIVLEIESVVNIYTS